MGAKLSLSLPAGTDATGKVVVVTGGNTGIGYETAKALAMLGAHTILACRSKERATAAVERMKEEAGKELPDKQLNVEYMQLDLSSFKSTKQFVTAFKEKNLPLHVLVNNAGLGLVPLTKTEDGFELQFQVNHLGHFLLTLELLPVILETAASSGDGRIVFVSSWLHADGVFDPSNFNAEISYNGRNFYNNSKLMNVMTAYALQRRLQGVGVTVSALNPGFVATEFSRNLDHNKVFQFMLVAARTVAAKDCKTGAISSINCAINPELKSQEAHFYDKDGKQIPPSQKALNEQHQEQLWQISVNAVKDYLSPEVMEKYGSANITMEPQASGEAAAEEGGKTEEPQATTKEEGTTEEVQATAEKTEEPQATTKEGGTTEEVQATAEKTEEPQATTKEGGTTEEVQATAEKKEEPQATTKEGGTTEEVQATAEKKEEPQATAEAGEKTQLQDGGKAEEPKAEEGKTD